MTAAKHTPGPWKLVDLRHQKGGQIRVESNNREEILAGRFNIIANVLAKGEAPDADAELIVAAPLVTDALVALYVKLVKADWPDFDNAMDDAKAALIAAGRLP